MHVTRSTFITHVLSSARTRPFVAGTIIVLMVALAWFAYYFFRGHRTFYVEVRDDGFYPAEVTIHEGDTVVFTNKASRDVWPASDPHPTHTDLSGFDPKHGLSQGQSWSYTFTSPGSWQYHDHLSPVSHGVVYVLGVLGKIPELGVCDGPCFDNLIRQTVLTKGIDAAYALFQQSYDSGNQQRGCHWTAHRIGEAAYDLYKQNKDFKITFATSYCAYGFYHGFMEKLLRDDPDPKKALAFCDEVEKQLGTMGLWNCYHGIGHGYTEDPPDPLTTGNFNAMIAPGIKMCEFLFGKDFRNLNLCLTGVFTVPTGFADQHKYGLSIDPKDPFAYCKDQPYRYWKACYGEFAAKLDHILNWNLSKLPAITNSLPDPKLQRLVTWVVPSVMMARDIMKPDQSSYITGCRDNFAGRLRQICWGGTILGFFAQGEPEKQYLKVIDFCNSDAWQTDEERTFCWGEGFRQMRTNYPLDKVKQICPEAPSKYHYLCLDANNTHQSPYDDPSFATQ